MSWINPDLQLQNLINLLNGIGNFVGYFNKWTPSDNNITVTNNETTITSTTNNVSYCYSSISYTDTFTLQATTGNNNTNMVLGISSDLSKKYQNPSSISMEMVSYGVLIDNQSQSTNCTIYLVLNGNYVSTTAITSSLLPTVKIVYDGSNLYFFQNNIEIVTFRQTITFTQNIFATVNSFYGGKFTNISWSGTGSAGGQTDLSLAEVLANGNSANNQSITNLNNVNCTILEANNVLANSYSGTSEVRIEVAESQSYMTLQQAGGNPVLSLINQYNNAGLVYDTFFNPSAQNISAQFQSTSNTRNILPAVGTSVLSLNLVNNMNISNIKFSIDSLGTAIKPGTVLYLYITAVKDEAYNANSGNLFTSGELTSNNLSVTAQDVILTYQKLIYNPTEEFYLNCLINYDNGGYYQLNNFEFECKMINTNDKNWNVLPDYTT